MGEGKLDMNKVHLYLVFPELIPDKGFVYVDEKEKVYLAEPGRPGYKECIFQGTKDMRDLINGKRGINPEMQEALKRGAGGLWGGGYNADRQKIERAMKKLSVTSDESEEDAAFVPDPEKSITKPQKEVEAEKKAEMDK